jgi:hypothetical protein
LGDRAGKGEALRTLRRPPGTEIHPGCAARAARPGLCELPKERTERMRIVSAALAAVMFWSLPAPALAANINVFTAQEVVAILNEAGATDVQRDDGDGISFISFKLGDQPYSFSLRLCDKTDRSRCGGLLMAAAYRMSPQHNVELFNSFNRSVPFLTAVKLDSSVMAFGRFVISLGGVTRENVKANIDFLRLAPELFLSFEKSQVIASVDAGAAQLSQATAAPIKPEPVALTRAEMARLMDEALLANVKLP